MPNRSVLNKYALFASIVQKAKRKREVGEEDNDIIDRARLFAMLSSSHCWHVYKFISGEGSDKDAMASEIEAALSEGWKEISEEDMKEVINEDIEEHAFSTVLMYSSLNKEDQLKYRTLLTKMKEEFIDGMEPIMKEEA